MMHFTLPSLSTAPPTAPPPLTSSTSLSLRCLVADVDVLSVAHLRAKGSLGKRPKLRGRSAGPADGAASMWEASRSALQVKWSGRRKRSWREKDVAAL